MALAGIKSWGDKKKISPRGGENLSGQLAVPLWDRDESAMGVAEQITGEICYLP
jgi:hypothetical protein